MLGLDDITDLNGSVRAETRAQTADRQCGRDGLRVGAFTVSCVVLWGASHELYYVRTTQETSEDGEQSEAGG